MNYKYNEKEYGKAIFDNGFQSDFIKYELVVLVKYLKFLGYKKKETEEFLYEMCKRDIKGFNEVKYYKTIDGAIKDGRRYNNKLIEVKEIKLMRNEIEHIDSLEIEHEYKKLLLGLLVRKKISFEINKINNDAAKLSTYFSGGRKGFKEIFKMSNIDTEYKIDDMINKLVKLKIIKSVIKGDIGLTYAKDIEEGGEVYEIITDFENVGWVFDYYKGVNNIIKCSECGKLIKSTNNKIKYCKVCAKDKQFIQKKEWDKTKRIRKIESPPQPLV